jgi:hypothetical protein
VVPGRDEGKAHHNTMLLPEPYFANHPPSTGSAMPVVKLAVSLAK